MLLLCASQLPALGPYVFLLVTSRISPEDTVLWEACVRCALHPLPTSSPAPAAPAAPLERIDVQRASWVIAAVSIWSNIFTAWSACLPCRAVPARPALHTVPAWAQFYGRVLHNMACVRAAAAAAALLVALRPTLAYTARSLRGHP